MIFTFCLGPEIKLPIKIAREIVNNLKGSIHTLP